MAVRFQKRVKIAPGLRLNIGKRGASVNVGTRGLSVTKGRDGTHLNTALPGTGLSKRTKVGGRKPTDLTEPATSETEQIEAAAAEEAAIAEKRFDGMVFIVTFVVVVVVLVWFF